MLTSRSDVRQCRPSLREGNVGNNGGFVYNAKRTARKACFEVDFRFRFWVSRFRTSPGVLLFGTGRTIPEFPEKRPKMDWTTEKLKNRRNIAFP